MPKQYFNNDDGKLTNNPADLECTSITANKGTFQDLNVHVPEHVNEAAALAAGLVHGDLYMTPAGALTVVLDV